LVTAWHDNSNDSWYRALRYQLKLPKEMRIHPLTLMMWGVKNVALTHRIARPSIDDMDEGNLILFLDATHWLQRDAAEEVNHYLIGFFSEKNQLLLRITYPEIILEAIAQLIRELTRPKLELCIPRK
jgi:predicted class III extradiol MEMO1 family dioxygenase